MRLRDAAGELREIAKRCEEPQLKNDIRITASRIEEVHQLLWRELDRGTPPLRKTLRLGADIAKGAIGSLAAVAVVWTGSALWDEVRAVEAQVNAACVDIHNAAAPLQLPQTLVIRVRNFTGTADVWSTKYTLDQFGNVTSMAHGAGSYDDVSQLTEAMFTVERDPLNEALWRISLAETGEMAAEIPLTLIESGWYAFRRETDEQNLTAAVYEISAVYDDPPET